MWGQRAKIFLKSAGMKSESNQAMDFQESEDEEPSYALAILHETAKPEESMFYTVDGER